MKDKYRWVQYPKLTDLIPMETTEGQDGPPGEEWRKKVIIGHNVGFDRSFIKEQYYINVGI